MRSSPPKHCLHSADHDSYARQELRDGAMKSISREYYYIDYRRAIDAAKYKISQIDSRIKKDAKPTAEKAEYYCSQCKSQWTTMEVLDNVDPFGRDSGFTCKRCQHPLTALGNDDGPELETDDTPAKFNKLFKPLLDLMQRIDGVTIPAVEGKDALENAVPLPRDHTVNPGAKHEVVQETTVKPTAVKGTNNAVEKIEVQIATDSEYNEAARAAEKARQEKIAAQNLLPSWHTKSTVDRGQDGSSTAASASANGTEMPTIKTELVDNPKMAAQNLDDVFAALAAERAKKEAEEEDDDDDDDDDDGEFEDAMVMDGSNGGAPDAKRVKIESSAAATPVNMATPAISTGDGGDESDEDDFEDIV